MQIYTRAEPLHSNKRKASILVRPGLRLGFLVSSSVWQIQMMLIYKAGGRSLISLRRSGSIVLTVYRERFMQQMTMSYNDLTKGGGEAKLQVYGVGTFPVFSGQKPYTNDPDCA